MVLTTQWSEIERLQGKVAEESWRWFVGRYRGFVARAVRQMIWSPERAAEATEQFWGYLFASGVLERVGRHLRFRGFLVNTLRNYALDWMRRNPRLGEPTEDRRTDDSLLPEHEEVTLWARHLLYLALERLEAERPTWARLIRAVYGIPTNPEAEPLPPRRVSELVVEFGCSANTLHQVMYRARHRLRDMIVAEVRQTVSGRRDLEAELEMLLSALGRDAPGVFIAAGPRDDP
jgi:DNA-directed RNA polymerase specialized sigma24 family protein